MPRLARKNLESSFLHIIVQGINRMYIFQNDSLKLAYKNILKKNLVETNAKIIAYCIMDNHAHLLLFSENINEVSQIMRKTNTSFAMLYNKINKRVGYVFRDRYYVQMILNESHLYKCISYIHKNPLKAGITKSLMDYKFSSYLEYYHEKELLTPESIQLAFGSDKNSLDILKEIHKIDDIEDIKDVVDDYINPNTLIKDYLFEKSKTFEDVKSDTKLLGDLLILLRHSSRSFS